MMAHRRSRFSHWLNPSQNNFSLYFVGVEAVVVILALLLALHFLTPFIARSGVNSQGAAVLSATLTDLSNVDRMSAGLPLLLTDDTLTLAATLKARDMAARHYFAHVDPEGREPWYWFSKVEYAFTYAGENLAVNFTQSGDVETAWMNSALHKDNILNRHYTRMGLGIARGLFQGQASVYVVEFFAAPASPSASRAPSIPVHIAPSAGMMPASAVAAFSERAALSPYALVWWCAITILAFAIIQLGILLTHHNRRSVSRIALLSTCILVMMSITVLINNLIPRPVIIALSARQTAS